MSLERTLEKALSFFSSVPVDVTIDDSAPEHLKTGVRGENLAAKYLASLGHRLLARNVRSRFGEIDIVARDGEDIVFAEVRTRSVGKILPADRTVGPDKLKKLVRAARIWVSENNYEGFWRIDLVAVTINPDGQTEIEHIKDITEGIQ